jgi:hypothetical protein
MLAEAQDNSEFLVAAHIALGTTLLFLGQFGAAHRHFIQVKALYDPAQHRSLPMLYGGFEPTVYRLCYEAYLLWMQGYSDQSRQRSDETLSLAQRLSSPYSLVYALSHSAIHFQFRQDGAAVHRLAAEAVILAREQGFSTFVGAALVLAGWAAVQQGQPAGLNQLRQGLAVYQNVSFLPYFHALWADACLTLGQIDEGLAALAEAMTLLENTDEQFWAAEIYRLKGELLLQKQTTAGESAAAESPEACFLQAIDLAHSQQASVLELRAAVSLGRLWHTQGRTAEARQRLEALYGRFSEGFESVDLQTAAAMIKALGGEGVSHHDQSSPF